MVRIAAESEPQPGSVIAIAAQVPPKRLSCSSLATAAIAALPNPWRGMASSRPTSPQHSSITPSRADRLPPFLIPSCCSLAAPRLLADVAPMASGEPAFMPSSSAASRSSSLG
ncbi:hypothetical protein D9M68_802190 [compost metagenome]